MQLQGCLLLAGESTTAKKVNHTAKGASQDNELSAVFVSSSFSKRPEELESLCMGHPAWAGA